MNHDLDTALEIARQPRAHGGLDLLHVPHTRAKKLRAPRAFRQAQHRIHTGPIHSSVAGRTDHLPIHVPSGSYVIPADIVSGMGEGNTIAGFKHLRRMFGGTPYGGGGQPYGQSGGPYGMASGGEVKHHAAGILFVTPEKKILLLKRTGKDHQGEWALPGGGIEDGESPQQAARRELDEEAGKHFDGKLEPCTRRVKEGVDFVTFKAHVDEFKPKLNSEHSDYKWLPIDEALDANLHPGVRDTIETILKPRGKASGGEATGVPIVAAGGEHVLTPDEVRHAGAGDLDTGHKVLDQFVLRMRKELVKTLSKLPGPKRD